MPTKKNTSRKNDNISSCLIGNTFCNPVPFSDNKRRTNPDPFVIEWCGTYYCYATGEHGVNVSSSQDLVRWQSHGYAIQQENHTDFWAPSVIYLNGTFYMYYSHNPGEIMQLAVADTP